MSDPNTRLRLATRIHFALLRHLGEGIDVGAMLRDRSQAREVLWVCQASGNAELMRLAREFEWCSRPTAKRPPAADTGWGAQTTGFSLTAPAPLDAGGTPWRWASPTHWLRRLRAG